MTRYVDDGATDGYLNLFNFVEHQQPQMSVKAVHAQGLIERGTRFENMILLRCCQKWIKVCAESVIADVAKIVLRPCCILNEKSARLQQDNQLAR